MMISLKKLNRIWNRINVYCHSEKIKSYRLSLGGIAYVYDTDGSFKDKCNSEMVELLPLELEDDLNDVKKLLQEFVELTG